MNKQPVTQADKNRGTITLNTISKSLRKVKRQKRSSIG